MQLDNDEKVHSKENLDDDGDVEIGGCNNPAVQHLSSIPTEFKLKVEDVDKNEAKMIPPQLQMDYAVESTKQLTPVVISPMVDMDKTLEPME